MAVETLLYYVHARKVHAVHTSRCDLLLAQKQEFAIDHVTVLVMYAERATCATQLFNWDICCNDTTTLYVYVYYTCMCTVEGSFLLTLRSWSPPR